MNPGDDLRSYNPVMSSLLRKLALWFDAGATTETARISTKRVDWVRVAPFVGVHLMCFGVIWVGWSANLVALAVGMYALRMFAITGFYHRYFSHRTFQTSRAAQFAFAVLGASAAQRGPLWWAAHHRKHHRHSDTELDVHSPKEHGFLWSHMGWITSPANFPTDLDEVRDLAKYPELRFLDRFDVLVPVLLGGLLFLVGGWPFVVWGFFISTVFLFHCTCFINSLAHRIGTQRYDTHDESGNSFALAVITLGEGWHNNHHKYPGAARQGFFWWELDITYCGLVILQALRIVRDLRPVPERLLRAA